MQFFGCPSFIFMIEKIKKINKNNNKKVKNQKNHGGWGAPTNVCVPIVGTSTSIDRHGCSMTDLKNSLCYAIEKCAIIVMQLEFECY